jgi:hypothetical protein
MSISNFEYRKLITKLRISEHKRYLNFTCVGEQPKIFGVQYSTLFYDLQHLAGTTHTCSMHISDS